MPFCIIGKSAQMANALDLALVEEELRAAEAYLSHRSAVKSANERPSTYAASESGKAPSFDTSTSQSIVM